MCFIFHEDEGGESFHSVEFSPSVKKKRTERKKNFHEERKKDPKRIKIEFVSVFFNKRGNVQNEYELNWLR